MLADWLAELERASAGKQGVQQIAVGVMGNRRMGAAGNAALARSRLRTLKRLLEGIGRSFELFESSSSGASSPFALMRATAPRLAESRLALRGLAARKGDRAEEGSALWRASDSSVTRLASAATSMFFRARSHWARRASTSACTHSSKISCNSLRRFATAFRRVRWNDSMEASDEVAKYSRGRSMAFCRDAAPCFASPLELGIAGIDIINVITSYSTEVAVPA